MRNYTDQQIVDSLKNRESHVVSYLANKFIPLITYMIKGRRADFIEVDDLFQDVLMIIIKKIDSGEFILRARFSTYFYAICKNLVEYNIKKNNIQVKYLSNPDKLKEEEEENFSESYDDKLQQKLYQHYYAKLGESCQEVLKMFWLDVPLKEIAQKMGSTEGFIRKKKFECKKRLVELVLSNPDNIKPD